MPCRLPARRSSRPAAQALLGPSGAGKSTLMDMLAQRKSMGALSGAVLVDGAPADGSFIRRTAYVPQYDNFVPVMSTREVRSPARGSPSAAARPSLRPCCPRRWAFRARRRALLRAQRGRGAPRTRPQARAQASHPAPAPQVMMFYAGIILPRNWSASRRAARVEEVLQEMVRHQPGAGGGGALGGDARGGGRSCGVKP